MTGQETGLHLLTSYSQCDLEQVWRCQRWLLPADVGQVLRQFGRDRRWVVEIPGQDGGHSLWTSRHKHDCKIMTFSVARRVIATTYLPRPTTLALQVYSMERSARNYYKLPGFEKGAYKLPSLRISHMDHKAMRIC